MDRFPDFIAACTTAGPPVIAINGICSFWQIRLNDSMLGSSMVQMRFSMPSSRWMAWL